jgi:hypothetical protein
VQNGQELIDLQRPTPRSEPLRTREQALEGEERQHDTGPLSGRLVDECHHVGVGVVGQLVEVISSDFGKGSAAVE